MQRLIEIVTYPVTAPMDFKGQSDTERLYQLLIAVPTFLGFLHGYAMADFKYTLYWWAAASALAAILVIPVWPTWSRNNVTWLPNVDDDGAEDDAPAAKSEGGKR